MSEDNGTVHRYGLGFYEDVWQMFLSRKITALQAILLAHVDYFCCPYQSKRLAKWLDDRYEEEGIEIPEPRQAMKSKRFTTRTLRKILQCSTKTVHKTIANLHARFHRTLFLARKVSKTVWELRTAQRNQTRAFYIPPQLRKLYEDGKYTAMELFVMAEITRFTRSGLYCWLSDRQIGKRLGLKIEGVRWHLKQLRQKNELVERIMKHDEAREWLKEIGYDKPFHRRGNKITRFLLPTRKELRGHAECDFIMAGLPLPESKRKIRTRTDDEEDGSLRSKAELSHGVSHEAELSPRDQRRSRSGTFPPGSTTKRNFPTGVNDEAELSHRGHAELSHRGHAELSHQ